MTPRDRQHSLVDILIALHEDDPVFKYATSVLSLRAGQVVAEPSVLARSILILISGRIELIYHNPNWPSLTLATLGPGAVFGAGVQPRRFESSISANALTDCIVWIIPESQAQELVAHYPALRWGMLQTVSLHAAERELGQISDLSISPDEPCEGKAAAEASAR